MDIQGVVLLVVETDSAKGRGWVQIVTEQLGGQDRGKQRVLDGRVVGGEGAWRAEVFGLVSQGKVFVFALLVQREI